MLRTNTIRGNAFRHLLRNANKRHSSRVATSVRYYCQKYSRFSNPNKFIDYSALQPEPITQEKKSIPWLRYFFIGLPIVCIGGCIYMIYTAVSYLSDNSESMLKEIRKSFAGGPSFLYGETPITIEEDVTTKFSDVIGFDEIKKEIQFAVSYLKDPSKFADIGAEAPKGILFTGAPGTGKTLLAKAIAGEANIPFISAHAANFDKMFVGSGVHHIRVLFEKAKKMAPCIIFMDELDALASNRDFDVVKSPRAVSQLLQELDGFQTNEGILFIGVTNIPDNIDRALLRAGRLGKTIQFNPPDVKTREKILDYYLNKVTIPRDVNIPLIAKRTREATPATLAGLVSEGLLLALKNNPEEPKLTDKEMLEAIYKANLTRSKNTTDDRRELISVAYYESGRAIIAYHAKKEIHAITIEDCGSRQGNSMFDPTQNVNLTRRELIDLVDIQLGGRVAEEIIFGDNISNGAAEDLAKARQIAKTMIIDGGMSSLGYLGNNVMSGEKKDRLNNEIQQFLNERKNHVKQLLLKHKNQLDLLANNLLERERITGDELNTLLEGKKE